ncbi:MAG: toxin-antitoxin system [Tomitella sp.]|nr:toxin-antitoxin system [Tomitella sp.]
MVAMMPSKGSRTRVLTRLPDDVLATLDRRREEAGIGSMSQYIADLLAIAAGHPQAVRELTRQEDRMIA